MDNENYKILIVDDEADMLDFISYNLKTKNFQIFTTDNGAEAIRLAKENIPHLILLDVMMPGMDGIETCEELRKTQALDHTIIAFLTARGEDYSQIAGFEAGGDDYSTKHVRPKVLYSRIKALLKRFEKSSVAQKEEVVHEMNNIIKKKDLMIDRERFVVMKNNEELILPKKEFELLSLLISKPDKVFTRDQIFHEVWGDNIVVSDRTIDVHIRKLREKIGDKFIKTVKGVGYKFVE